MSFDFVQGFAGAFLRCHLGLAGMTVGCVWGGTLGYEIEVLLSDLLFFFFNVSYDFLKMFLMQENVKL